MVDTENKSAKISILLTWKPALCCAELLRPESIETSVKRKGVDFKQFYLIKKKDGKLAVRKALPIKEQQAP